jgi:hypothetical protein
VIREKPKLANPDEATREHVLDKAPKKFVRGERHRPLRAVVRVVFPAERVDLELRILALKRGSRTVARRQRSDLR